MATAIAMSGTVVGTGILTTRLTMRAETEPAMTAEEKGTETSIRPALMTSSNAVRTAPAANATKGSTSRTLSGNISHRHYDMLVRTGQTTFRVRPLSMMMYVSVDMFARMRLLYWLEVLSLLEMTEKVTESVELVEVWLKTRPQQVVPNSPELPAPKILGRIATSITEGLMKTQAGIRLRKYMIHMRSGPLSLRALDHAKRFLADILPIQRPDESFEASALPKESDISTLGLLQDLKNFIVEFEVPIKTSAPHIYHSALPFTPSHTSLSRVYGHLAEGGPKARRGSLQQWSQRTAHPCIAWSPDGQRIVSGSQDGTLCLWDPSTGARIGEAWKFHTREVCCVAWSPDGKMIVSGSQDSTLQLWDSTTGARIGEAWKGHANYVRSLAWSPDSKRVVSGSDDVTLRIWHPSTGKCVECIWKAQDKSIQCVTWSPDGKRIASGPSDNGHIYLWEPSTGVLVEEFLEETFRCPRSLAWSPDGKKIISANGDKSLRLWNAYSGEPVGEPWKDHPNIVQCIAWSPDGKRIVSGSEGNTLRLWDASTGGTGRKRLARPYWCHQDRQLVT
ncbi:hypothetical protein FRB93_008381 [Tulasnella sp. JGI-2019a]|nr:hypothetical protein FRB93_008381 [Tulasnella sp. JGI-2019a]